MKRRIPFSNENVSRLMTTDELRAYTNLGRDSAKEFGKKIGACVHIGNRTLWDRKKVDQYIDTLTKEVG